jgi:hypothetical protein
MTSDSKCFSYSRYKYFVRVDSGCNEYAHTPFSHLCTYNTALEFVFGAYRILFS